MALADDDDDVSTTSYVVFLPPKHGWLERFSVVLSLLIEINFSAPRENSEKKDVM